MISQLKEREVNTIKDKEWNCLIEEDAIMSRWPEYCTEQYTRPVSGDTSVLNVINEIKEPQLPILRYEIETAVNALKIGKSPGH